MGNKRKKSERQILKYSSWIIHERLSCTRPLKSAKLEEIILKVGSR